MEEQEKKLVGEGGINVGGAGIEVRKEGINVGEAGLEDRR